MKRTERHIFGVAAMATFLLLGCASSVDRASVARMSRDDAIHTLNQWFQYYSVKVAQLPGANAVLRDYVGKVDFETTSIHFERDEWRVTSFYAAGHSNTIERGLFYDSSGNIDYAAIFGLRIGYGEMLSFGRSYTLLDRSGNAIVKFSSNVNFGKDEPRQITSALLSVCPNLVNY